ncbi:hypothetical protein [Brevundimonas sp. FT23028]|uniref:hypothetical protein n=1 Tax=Brevundimonas sp. FT23028 TaxID=3393748 RepID=UPI003B586F9C
MRLTVVPMLALLALAACGERTDAPASSPAEKAAAGAPVSDATVTAPAGALTAADLRRVCRAGLAAIHGQEVSAIAVDGLEGEVVNLSWRAPVDGGRRRGQCRVDGDMIVWKPVDAPTVDANRWMNRSGDPVTRYVLDGDAVTINTTLPDGTSASQTVELAAERL